MNINPCLVLCECSLSISLDADPLVSPFATGPCPGAPREVVAMQSDVGQGFPMQSNWRAPVHACTSGAVRKGWPGCGRRRHKMGGGPVSWEQRQKEVEAAQGSEERGPGSLAVSLLSLAVGIHRISPILGFHICCMQVLMVLK
uniref:NINP6167 n=1 Tax=Homo sapiens TaxID=9606 RepID=Q6UXV6_HUMAN|nr:NINP6167 [Homo sapiens]